MRPRNHLLSRVTTPDRVLPQTPPRSPRCRLRVIFEGYEDETNLWTVTRYVHQNPFRAAGGAAGGVEMVELSGLRTGSRRLEWVAYDERLASWAGEFGGSGRAGVGVPSVRHGGIVAATRAALGRCVPRLDPRQPEVRQSRQGDGGQESTATGSAPGRATDARVVNRTSKRGRLRRVRDRAFCVEPTGQPAPGPCGDGVSGEASHGGNEWRVDGDPRRVACGERPEPDAPIRRLALKRSAGSQAVGAYGTGVGQRHFHSINLELGLTPGRSPGRVPLNKLGTRSDLREKSCGEAARALRGLRSGPDVTRPDSGYRTSKRPMANGEETASTEREAAQARGNARRVI